VLLGSLELGRKAVYLLGFVAQLPLECFVGCRLLIYFLNFLVELSAQAGLGLQQPLIVLGSLAKMPAQLLDLSKLLLMPLPDETFIDSAAGEVPFE
jgi:hypothetical protein